MYSQDSKDKALGMLRLTGDVEKTARMSGVPGRTLLCFATLILRFSRHIFFGFHVFRQRRASDFPSLRTCPS